MLVAFIIGFGKMFVTQFKIRRLAYELKLRSLSYGSICER